MSLLIEWVTQIIIFIILAAIIDLLVPASSMKKYIKFVVGLLLILIFLKPFFSLFNIDLQHAFNTSLQEIFEDDYGEENMENLIDIQKSEIESSQNAYILEQMAVQFKDLANTPLIEKHQVEISDIDFKFAAESSYSFENLEEVIVYIQESEEGEGAIYAVDDVVINTKDPVVDENNEDLMEISGFLEEIWELKDKKLSVFWEGGSS
ncbi:stage III sporulation protein AF [Ornithinibacillus sp. L9]|uniref:Stage III sporulation protein AF n=1 Tax=Ornithinibacillus caprae TaxID=2678566 RepID=A0A6N8FC82_9BACI|nr:stage III sporulation protein AF [Ornithinibacillus caprae]MUK87163.1 stage III sporulation protein AF [Ornithinibacillus caprae]